MFVMLTKQLQRAALALLFAGAAAGQQAVFERTADRINILFGERPFSAFYFEKDQPKPFLHPLRAPDGTPVTRFYPMEDVPGESQDHPHHRGLWFSHGDVNGYDFWANEPGGERGNKGRIIAREVEALEEEAGIRGVFEWRTPEGRTLLTERRTMRFHAGPPRMIDFDLRLTAEEKPAVFGDTKEGTFALRVATPLEEPHESAGDVRRTGRIQSAGGRTGEPAVWGTRSPWVDYSGVIDGKPLGVAIFDHPDNPRHPAYWHVRSYGLFAANIFGLHDFLEEPPRDGSLRLEPGETLRLRYRVVIHEGRTGEARIGELYEEYAAGVAAEAGHSPEPAH